MSEASIESCFVEYPARDWQDSDVAGTLRLAVVGLGRFARNRALPAIADSSLCEVTTLVSGSPEKAERLATEYDAEHVLSYEDFRDARAVDAYDAVYVATPNASHAQYTEVAAAQGKPVLCEKPLATSVEEGEEMVEACEDAGVTLMTAYRLQAEPAVRRVRELVAEGVIGDPKHISGWFAYRNPDQSPSANNWRRDSSVAGGGAMIDLGVYPLNTAPRNETESRRAQPSSWHSPTGWTRRASRVSTRTPTIDCKSSEPRDGRSSSRRSVAPSRRKWSSSEARPAPLTRGRRSTR
jgi:xylose dehydrogenase (NAD/NADP)